ncbi:PREDICTED: uncharacterized protein LOC109342237 [Lupinus angustifolius]|uniref:uncharacterized protein LOC109342237 n=1 Tax=Lupinus angustifolius TaxID=3871 RepID=UPI00092FA8BC|nr:PREDICTED: uncharacterized protein LOC109342237 [Lupinus angustifolius]
MKHFGEVLFISLLLSPKRLIYITLIDYLCVTLIIYIFVIVEDEEESYVYIHEEGVGGGVDIPVKPYPLPPFNIPSAPPPPSPVRHNRKSANLLGNAEARKSKGYMNFPQVSRKTMLGTRSKQYTYSLTCDPSNFKFTEPENSEDASVLRHHNMVRPSEIDGRVFRHAFQAKTSRTKNDGKTHYGGVPKVQDVGQETNN